MKYRSRTEIITTMLETARSGATKTRMMYKAYVSYSQLTEYMKLLQDSGLITYEKGTQIYRVTEKGMKFLHASNEINELMDSKPKNYQYL